MIAVSSKLINRAVRLHHLIIISVSQYLMATSSTGSTSFPYDVFINHRGPDVKNTFATHLYRRLLDHGLRVFLDKPELLPGHEITRQIEAAIRVASVHVAIFSPRYAESKWCLDELVLMVESRATILPVFYKVKPSDLRCKVKDGAYAEALRHHQQKTTSNSQTVEKKPLYDFNTIQNWRNALSHSADIAGFELEACNGDEDELLNKLVQCVLKKIPKTPLYVAKYPTGLLEKLEDFETTVLRQQQREEELVEAKVVGIVGVGGVGKTTLAKEFYNSKRSFYNEASFLFEVRETSSRMSLNYLQSKLVRDLKHRNIEIESSDEGVGILKRNLLSCHALIILDDVDNAHQLEMLLPIKDVLNPESLILVTSRDKHVLKSSGVLDSSIYHLKGLSKTHSKELFCSYAFYQPLPAPEFADLVDQFVTACDGLPLSLKVMGALVCGENDELYWEEQLDRLHRTLPSEIHERLRISYDSLSKEDQPIFLDIACFFIGEDRDRAIRIWGLVGLRNLENKCLLEVDGENKIRMHDHIRDCARNIAEEGSMPRRLWNLRNPTNNVIDDLLAQSSSAITEVRGISTMISSSIDRDGYLTSEMSRDKSSTILGQLFNNFPPGMRNLQLVATENMYLEGILKTVQSPHLIWLRWHSCSYSSLPSWIPMGDLRVLEVEGSRLNILWPEPFQAPLQLRELNIWAPLAEFPKSIMQLKHLEWISVNPFGAPTVETLPEEFCHLRSLKYLVLKSFSRMVSLPDSFGKLTNLQHIELGGASGLQMLPNSFGNLVRLKHLSLEGASRLQMLPNSFGNLNQLEHLSLERASALQMLPNCFGNLSRLKHLSLKGCHKLTISSGTLGNISTLEYMDLRRCSNVKDLPPQVVHQRSLEKLFLNLTNLKELPNGIGDLCNLEVLEIGDGSLEVLPPSLGFLKSLKQFSVSASPKLKCVPDSLGLLPQLTQLRFERCGIEILSQDLLKSNSLEILKVWDCPLREHPFKTVEGEAKTLLLRGGTALNKLNSPTDRWMFGVKRLELRRTKISEVAFPEGVCPNLQKLSVIECGELRQIGELCGLAKLESLDVIACVQVEELGSLETLRSLERLDVSECKKLKRIQGLQHLTKLRLLFVSGCHEIVGLSGVEHCRLLEYLNASECPKLEGNLGLGQLTKLQRVIVSGCHELVGLQGVEHCFSLKSLDASDCPKLQWGGGVLQHLRHRLKGDLRIDVKRYKRRKLCA